MLLLYCRAVTGFSILSCVHGLVTYIWFREVVRPICYTLLRDGDTPHTSQNMNTCLIFMGFIIIFNQSELIARVNLACKSIMYIS